MTQLFSDIYKYHELIWALALKELRVRYKRSMLGFFWALLNPLFTMLILTAVFSKIMRVAVDHYSIFLISALLPWTFFSQAAWYAAESIVANGDLLKKVQLAKSVFPIAAVVSNLINFLLSLIPLVLLVVVLRFPLHWTWIYLPVPMIGLFLFTLGFGFFVAAANVFFRDVAHILQIVLSAWFYLSPVIYSLDFLPTHWRLFFKLNPMLYVLNGFRLSIYYGKLPSVQSVAASVLCGVIALVVGFTLFRRTQDAFVFYV